MPVNTQVRARLQLAALWFSQAARIVADNTLRAFILLRMAQAGPPQSDYAWHLVAGLLTLPAVFLAPLTGAVCNSLPKRWVLTGSAAFVGAVVAILGIAADQWIACWALVAVGAALYSPARYALLPAAATDTRIPLTRVNGWIEMGAVVAIVAGFALSLAFKDGTYFDLPATVVAVVGLNLVGAALAALVAFPSDICRRAGAREALAGFFHDGARILRDGDARGMLMGMATLRAIVTAATGAIIAVVLHGDARLEDHLETFATILAWVLTGAAAGSVLAGVQRHLRRALGLVPLGATGLVVGLFLAATIEPTPLVCLLLGAMGGLINVPLAAAYQLFVPADARGNAMAIRNFTDYVFMTAAAALLFGLAKFGLVTPSGQLWVVVILAVLGAIWAWAALHRETAEQSMEWLIWPLYRIRAYGISERIPVRGPVLVVANHAAWFDPIWLAKVLPRRCFPMMTSLFYDLPGMKWIMEHIVHAIRVQDSSYRREAPELRDAIAYLDLGRCVILFPEGSLRKSEERPLRRFGQGVWHILNERPATPVVVCWIEGNWGSFFSYWRGSPTKNKRMDFWRHIDIAVGEPFLMEKETLTDQLATRSFLEQRCREMREVLGLPIPPTDARSTQPPPKEVLGSEGASCPI
jgi:1-acyl-sn-glycerol-3-phosphate acyltransferase